MELFDYSKIIEESLQFAVKRILQIAEKNGLFGGHHFFISFKTDHPGVQISERIRSKYPTEITIVLQHQFEELYVDDKLFSVVLSFNNVKEKIVVPFCALTAFADPSVKFGLQFKAYYDTDDDSNETYQGEPELKKNKVEIKPVPTYKLAEVPEAKPADAKVIDFRAFKNKKKK